MRKTYSNCAARTAAIATILAAMSAASAADIADSQPAPIAYPYIEGSGELAIGSDFVVSSDDPAGEVNDLFFEGELGLKVFLTPLAAINAGITAESVLDPMPFDDRAFGDIGLYVDTLNLELSNGATTFLAGKFGPGFGRAWDITPGVYGTELVEDYELSEQVGFALSHAFATAYDTHTLGANIFTADTSVLSESAFTNRGRLSRFDGGAGNTGRLDNFSVTLDGAELPGLDGISYHLGYRHLSAGFGDDYDENGFVAGLTRESELANGSTLAISGEAAYLANAFGSPDDALYLTAGMFAGERPVAWRARRHDPPPRSA
ncbi:hypothetical protein [Aliihoeflea sp. 40Bstr573]|uniref:hypothetical protein n=1 Tax=Aliihoeflea sp. 40Bstr573 TaxID=2696467 RepID=UPI002094E8D1|nr:hypothetical protein [Aliihoeflea sp. 40Bstr573]MCO6387238.1 hypothetical protein [Aliihoeflea sp. 40Bstr573]